eukprot:331455_1
MSDDSTDDENISSLSSLFLHTNEELSDWATDVSIDGIDADEENTESVDIDISTTNNDCWIDAESVTSSLQNFNDHGSILNHFQNLYQIENKKLKQKRKEQIRNSNKQIRSFSLSPKHKINRE